MLDVKEIDVAYGHAKVLHEVSVRLNEGETVFIVGRNGAGKTTLLRTIAGLLHPTKGTITHAGQEIQGFVPEEVARRGIRYVAQDKKVFSNLTVRGNVELAAHAAGEDLKTALKKLVDLYPKFSQFLDSKAGSLSGGLVDLYPKFSQFLDSKAGSLSGGQREILLIGRAVVGNPKILLIDEPTEGLAAIVIDEIFRILNAMKENKVSAIIVEQNLAVVAKLADRIYIMKEGKIDHEITKPREITDTKDLEEYL
ncbi:MAG: ATP-binding cassette domain-containing protein [Deltaproteobacteria bacterium]|nr:ATP-binding cassette domain-containing protein [Deltaproteobacteria bacterium]